MSDTVVLGRKEELPVEVPTSQVMLEKKENHLPSLETLEKQLAESSKLVEDIVFLLHCSFL